MKKIALLLLVAQGLFAAEPTYDLRFRFFPAVGRSMHFRSHETWKDTATLHDPAAGKEVTKPILDDTEDNDYVEKVVAVDGNEPVDYVRTYSKPADKSYSGHAVHFVKTNGKIQATSSGATLEELQTLEKHAMNSDLPVNLAMLPRGAVAVGQTWTVDPKPLVHTIGFTGIDPAHSTAVAKLVSVTKQNGHPIAIVEANLDLTLLADNGGKFPGPSPFHAKIRYEGAIDGSAWLRLTTNAGFTPQQQVMTRDGTKLNVMHDYHFTQDTQQEDVP